MVQMNHEGLSEDGVIWWPSDSNNYNGDREDTSSPRPLWSLCFSFVLCSLFLPILRRVREELCVCV